jgi:predicted ATPase
MKSKWYVITGSASTGKTTLVNSLLKLGYLTVPEAARVLIDEEIKNGKTIGEIRKNEAEFQKKVLDIKINVEKKLPKDRIVFFDRGIPDSVAYYQICGLDIAELLKLCKKKTYRKIFMLEQLPVEKDYARVEDVETINKIQILLRKAYSDLGYEIIDIPTTSLEKRLEMILSNIDSL